MRAPTLVLSAAVALGGCAATAVEDGTDAAPAPRAAATPDADYWVYVGAESADLIHRIRFGPGGTTVEKTIPVGEIATENEGPHGLAISRDGRYLHMTTGHGNPDGKIWRFELGPDTLVAPPIFLGMFPATIDVTPDGLYAFVVNFNLYGEHVPSTVSVVYTPEMIEVARTETCTMPHGSRVNAEGTKQYSACMMDDQVVEIDTRTFQVARRFSVASGQEGPVGTKATDHAGHDGHDAAMHAEHMQDPAHAAQHDAAHGSEPGAGHGGARISMGHEPSCSPTWAQPSADGSRVYVACNKSDEILEIGADDWSLLRRFPTGRGPYNLAVTPDGRLLIATLKQGGAVEFFDLAAGRSLATARSSITVTHGVVVSPDSRYAFISNEGVGAEPGRVDVYDIESLRRVGSAEVGQQAGGIAFWKMEPAR